MKTKLKIILLALFLTASNQQSKAQIFSVDFQVFYDELSPYGTWINNTEYGYVWMPNVPVGFSPYSSNGYWTLTNEGWTWVSDFPWGWAPFHYGRWFTDPMYGPMWVPDNEWGPGWVTWRQSAGFYGWAPIGPGISINMAYGNNYYAPANQWTFIREKHFGRRNSNSYYEHASNNTTIINNSTVINNIHEDRGRNVKYNTGPDRREVEKAGGRPITPVTIKSDSKPGERFNKGEYELYRPEVKRSSSTDARPAPKNIGDLKDVTPIKERGKEVAPKNEMQQPVKRNEQKRTEKQNATPVKERTDRPKAKEQVQPERAVPQKETPKRNNSNTNTPVNTTPSSRPVEVIPPSKEEPQNQPQRRQEPVRQQRSRQAPQTQPNRNTEPPHQQPIQQQRNNNQNNNNSGKRNR